VARQFEDTLTRIALAGLTCTGEIILRHADGIFSKFPIFQKFFHREAVTEFNA
jgi:hypothetical protein